MQRPARSCRAMPNPIHDPFGPEISAGANKLCSMSSDEYLRLMLRAMRHDAVYSSKRRAWVTATLSARIFFLEQMDILPDEFSSVEEVIEEGVQCGFWEIDSATDVLLMK